MIISVLKIEIKVATIIYVLNVLIITQLCLDQSGVETVAEKVNGGHYY